MSSCDYNYFVLALIPCQIWL